MPLQPAVLGPNTRLNNFRLNYLTAAQAADRPYHVRILIGGVDVTRPDSPTRVIYKSIAIQDVLFDAPNTCRLTLYGVAPAVGQPIEVWVNSNAPVLLFTGELQTVERTYKGRPSTVLHPVTAIDDTARANRRRPLMRFVNVSATDVAKALIAAYVPGFSTAGVEAGLPAISITLDGSEAGVKGCLTAIAKLIGGYWYFEAKTLYLFVTAPLTRPDPIDDTPGRFLHDPAITWTIDKSQVRTRVFGKGASTRIVAALPAAADLVPLENVEMFPPAGGQAIAAVTPDGAACRVLTYTGVQLGGGGGLVGLGAAPSAAPGLVQGAGAGIDAGAHGYAITFVTAAGESLAGPVGSITVGIVTPPAAAPVAGAPSAGGAIPPGAYDYAVTFQTASGETTGSPASAVVTTVVGLGVPTPGATSAALRKVVGNLVDGVAYRYGTTFTVAGGETLGGPASESITPVAPPGPTIPGHGYTFLTTGNIAPGNYRYKTAYVVGGTYETPMMNAADATFAAPNAGMQFFTYPSADPRVTGIKLYRSKVNSFGSGTESVYLLATVANASAIYNDTKADAELGAGRLESSQSSGIGTPPGDQATVTIPTSTDARTVGRKIYRSEWAPATGAWTPYRYLATINNNTATSYIDNTASVAAQPDAPVTDTSGGASYRTVPLSGIATGPALVTGRRIYRRPVGGAFYLVGTIANNTGTTFTDTAASVSTPLPPATSAFANRVTVTLPIGGASVTQRNVYRTAANQTPLKLVFGVANNTATTATDTYADSTLGAAPPGVDTSGLAQPTGQVPAGAVTLPVANAAPFAPTGGWAVIGNGEQAIRYTGTTPTSLTGIPATGPGAIVASVAYNSTVTAAPTLVGVTGVIESIIRNSPIHVWVQRDDLAAQAYMALLDGQGDGVYEHIWSDERRSAASLIQVCDAQLALYSRPLVTVTYAARDLKTKSGRLVSVRVATPAIAETLTIQDVAITEIGIRGLWPKFTVTASTVRHSFENVLQLLIRKAGA